MISRKNGKTALAAAIALASIVGDRHNGAEVYCIANNTKQADISFNAISSYATSLDPKHRIFEPFLHKLRIPSMNSVVNVLSSDNMSLDGLNASCFILDEIHAAKTFDAYNVLRSSLSMRSEPLALVITTAGFLVGSQYPCYSMWETCIDILKGRKKDDELFAAIYQLDKDDDYKDESVWTKCMPSYPDVIRKKYVTGEVTSAKNNSALKVGVLTKTFNIWLNSSSTWIPREYLAKCMQDVDIKDYFGEMCYMGTDLSSTADLTSYSIMIPPNPERQLNPDKFIFKSWVYVPESALEETINGEVYKTFINMKCIKKTTGNVCDYDEILRDLLRVSNEIGGLMEVAYDSWNASMWAINATEQGLPLVPYSLTLGSFNKPTKFFEMLVRSGKVIIDTNPVILWMFGNAELKVDHQENCKPVKANGDKVNKIDGVISMLEALGGYLNSPYYDLQPEIFAI